VAISRVKDLYRELLLRELDSLPTLKRAGLLTFRVIGAIIRDLTQGQLTLRAMSMVYTTLLSLVPLLAVSVSVLKGFGVHEAASTQDALAQLLAPLGERGAELSVQIVAFVDNINGRALGAAGLAFLIYTAFSLIAKVEAAFNWVWRVQEARTLGRRLSEYLSVLLIGPMTIVVAMGVTASMTSRESIDAVTDVAMVSDSLFAVGRLVPYVLVISVFTFLYSFMPNTRVRIIPAAIGALAAGFLWQSAGVLFATFVASSSQTTIIYSGFAIGVFFLIWLYLSWMILLVGASISFYVQNPRYTRGLGRVRDLANRGREEAALAVMYLVARTHRDGGKRWTTDDLARYLVVPTESLHFMFARLRRRGLIIDAAEGGLLPARALTDIKLREIVSAVRDAEGHGNTLLPDDPMTDDLPIQQVLDEIETAYDKTLGDRTLSELV
jgi:membrane protein